jgi:uncharacterized iron-regulated protein
VWIYTGETLVTERTRYLKLIALCAWVLLFCGCQRTVHSEQEQRETKLGTSHVLRGKIYDVRQRRFTTSLELFASLGHTPYVLLGEKHDNVDHHHLHARVIAALPKADAILLEMISLDKADRVHKTQGEFEFQEASDWQKSGWPEYAMYRPKIKAIYAHQLRPGAAHPSRTSVFKAMRGSGDGQGSPLTQLDKEKLSLAIDRAHCGHLETNMIEMMTRAQIYKDKTMAHQLIKQTAGGRGILIAGNAHLRSDYGVPKYLPRSTSLVFIEVRDEWLKTEAYDIEQYDYVWFTPRADNEDPCKKFEEQLRRIKGSSHHK